MTQCWLGKQSLRRMRRPETTSSAALPHIATSAIETEVRERSRCSPISQRATLASRLISGFLASPQNPRPDWAKLAASFTGKFKTPTLRNVDKRPRPDFVKAYMHNGYLKSLKEVVHFYNTRDALPRCQANDPGEKKTCWPAPEFADTMNKRQLGNLHLTEQQEDQIVAFLKTLTDGFEGH